MLRCASRTFRSLMLAFVAGGLSACAYLPQDDQNGALTLATTSEEDDAPAVGFEAKQGVADYEAGGGKKEHVEWMSCKTKGSKAALLAVHSDRAAFVPKDFCADWPAQAFLRQGIEVLAVNRPGFGKSTGAADFGGAQSQAAMAAGLAAAAAEKALDHPVVGVWGYDSGVIAAGLFARQHGKLNFMLLGGGLYDLDDVRKSSADPMIKKEIANIVKLGGEKALEDRSIAYDIAGFPKNVVIYHGKADTAAPVQQAKAFSDSLATGGYRVNFQQLDGLTHDIPPKKHRRILEVLARSIVDMK